MPDSQLINDSVRVIVIEDNPDDCEFLLHHLKKSGMDSHVKFITNGQEALDFLTGPRASALADELIAIFLDLRLPSLDGLELFRHIRARDKFQNLPVIVMTSSNDPKDLAECRRLNVTSYVSKPVSFPKFFKAVADIFHLPEPREDPHPQKES